MKKSKINSLDDKDLQLRYYLGGLQLINDGKEQLCHYWTCDIDCSCTAVCDDEKLTEVKKFISKHNLTNERFIKLSYCLLTNSVMKYKGKYSPFFIELERVIEPFGFIHTTNEEIQDNDFREKELENIVKEPAVKKYCSKYQLDEIDFIVLAKMSINYRFYILQVAKNPNDVFAKELCDIIGSHDLYVSREYIKDYNNSQKTTSLLIETKIAQKKYLELMKKLQKLEPNLANEMISEELNELGFNSKKDVTKLILRK